MGIWAQSPYGVLCSVVFTGTGWHGKIDGPYSNPATLSRNSIFKRFVLQ